MILQPGARVWAYTPPPLSQPGHPGFWEEVVVGSNFGDGGTANVHKKEPFPASRTLIKVFHLDLGHHSRADFHAKIRTLAQRHLKLADRLPFVAWPEALVMREKVDHPKALIGCTLPLVDNAAPLAAFCVDHTELKAWLPSATPDTPRQVGLNLIEALEQLHRRQVLFGDPNANNILVDRSSLKVTLIDADSFAMSLLPPGGTYDVFYPPPVSTPGYRSPNVFLQAGEGNRHPITRYRPADDSYVLAIHLFMLLVPGFHPWNLDEQFACARRFAYGGPAKSLPDDCQQMMIFNRLPLPIRQAFIDAFAHGIDITPTRWRALFEAHWGYLHGFLQQRRRHVIQLSHQRA